jgi:formylmethanofuran dehydrogenase subunit C
MLRLVYRSTTTVPVEVPCLAPDQIASLTALQVAQLSVPHGNRPAPLGEFFDITGDPSAQDVLIEGDCSRVKWLGSGMKSGRLTIRGSAGMHTGAEMLGGELHVYGATSDWAGAEMRGGRLHLHGDAGHLVGAGYRGARRGMRGGTILVDGNAGNEIGATMRRGLIAVRGSTGDFFGVGMIAGTVLAFGPPGIRPAAGMKRGTVGFFGPPPPLLPTFRYACTYEPTFLRVYLRQLQAWGFEVPAGSADRPVRRYSGDLLALGKGEILLV